MLVTLAHRYLFPALWGGWVLYWWASSRDTKATIRKESLASRMIDVALLIAGLAVLAGPRSTAWSFWAGAATCAVGLLFAIWARRHLGRNWSGVVTIKENHELITSGPYAIVRHPIYTGLLLAILGSGISRGGWQPFAALALFALAFWRRIRHEEAWMTEQFGQAYDAYRQRVAAIIPFVL